MKSILTFSLVILFCFVRPFLFSAEDLDIKPALISSELSSSPTANFVASATTVRVGETVQLYDLSLNSPTAWVWSLPGSSSSTSILQNPSITYAAIGMYTVTLVVSNADGVGTVTETNYINVVNQNTICSDDTLTALSGFLFDSGGSSSDYSNGDNCSVLIDPGCAQSITLHFNSFATESGVDIMRIYDGSDTSGTLLLTLSGVAVFQPSVTANSGKMFITFESNLSSEHPGWNVSWTSVLSTTTPVSSFSVSNLNPAQNIPVQFTDMSANYPGIWLWDFGDGSTSILQNPSHSYATAGTFPVNLIVDNCFTTDTVTNMITVQSAPDLAVSVDSVSVVSNCFDTVHVDFSVFNNGLGDLHYELKDSMFLNGQNDNQLEVLFLTYSAGLAHNYPNQLAAINQYFTNFKLTELYTTSVNEFQNALIGKDVLMMPGTSNTLYAIFAPVIQSFVYNGGSVIICGVHDSGPFFQSGLFTGSLGTISSSGTLTALLPNDDLLNGTTPPYLSVFQTFQHHFTNNNVIDVMEGAFGQVVSYRDFGAGRVTYVGFDFNVMNANNSRILANAVHSASKNKPLDWLEASSFSGVVSPGDSAVISLTFFANNLGAGTHYDTIVISNNDALHNPTFIPISYTLNGEPTISLVSDSLNFGTAYAGYTSTDTVLISNLGCDTLKITSLGFSNPNFTSVTTSLDIPPYKSDTMFVDCMATADTVYNDTLIIYNNDTLRHVYLYGVGSVVPLMSYSPSSIDTSVSVCNDSVVVPITVYNSGSGVLDVVYTLETTNPNINNFASSVQDSISVPIADSLTFYVTLHSNNLVNGSYSAYYVLDSNHPFTSNDTIPINFHINGSPEIATSKTCMNFPVTQTNLSSIDSLYLYNTGCDTLFVNNLLLTTNDFSVNASPFYILPNDSAQVEVVFSPVTIGVFVDTLEVINNDTTLNICLAGSSIGSPVISFHPTSIDTTIYSCNDSVTVPITIYNTGSGPLNINLNTASISNSCFYDGFEFGNYNNWDVLDSNASFSIDSANAMFGEGCLKISGFSTYLGLQYDFTPDLIDYFAIKLKSESTAGTSNFVEIGNSSLPFGICTIYYLAPNKYKILAGNVITHNVQGNEWTHFELKNINYVTKQFDLFINGSLATANLGFTSSFMNDMSKITLYASDASPSYYDDVKIGTNTDPDWIILDADTLSIAVGDSAVINVSLYSDSLSSGTSVSDIVLTSNDPFLPSPTIPLTLLVAGNPTIYSSTTCLGYGTIDQHDSIVNSFWISNKGCDTLKITDIATASSFFTASEDSLYILPGDSTQVIVSLLSTTSFGSLVDTVIVTSNAGPLTICLNALVNQVPIVSTNPSSVSTSLTSCQDSIVIPITIYNTGGDSLNWSFQNTNSSSILLDSVLSRLNNNSTSITSLIPNMFSFNNGVSGTSIVNGGNNMYVSGNSLSTDLILTNYNVAYSSSSIVSAPNIFGPSGSYFTTKYNGLFVLAADIENMNDFNVTGTFGATANGTNDGVVLHSTFNGISYSGFVTRHYNTGALPSVNKLVIVEEPNTASHSFSTSSNTENFQVTGLSNSSRIYYLLYASAAGGYVDDQATQAIMDEFIAKVSTGNGMHYTSPSEGSIAGSDSVSILARFYKPDLNFGTNVVDLTLQSNDPLLPNYTIPITLDVPYELCTDFTYNLAGSCSGLVNFVESGMNSWSSYTWDFGDNTSSNLQNPSHEYTSVGFYTVQLICCSGTDCDSISYTVTISNVDGPVSASCIPSISSGNTSSHISNVTLNTINNTSVGVVSGYEDFSCSEKTNLLINTNYPISISTAGVGAQNIRVWIDINNNGQFETTEKLFESLNSTSPHVGNINVPLASVQGTPLRMRVGAELATSTIPDPCSQITYGEWEDYSIEIDHTLLPPVGYGNFLLLDTCAGSYQFTDLSSNNPTAWHWDFGDGTSSTGQNPSHIFTSAGTYNVVLTATNASGSGTYTQSITVSSAPLNVVHNLPSFESPNVVVSFDATANGAASWHWDFGDGNQANLQSAIHAYPTTGQYIVTLTVSNGVGCVEVITHTINIVDNLSLSELEIKFELYPNPNTGLIYINNMHTSEIESVRVFDETGRAIADVKCKECFTKEPIDILDANPGIYFVRVFFVNGETSTEKLVFKKDDQ